MRGAGPERRRPSVREGEEEDGYPDGGASDQHPGPERRIVGALGGLAHQEERAQAAADEDRPNQLLPPDAAVVEHPAERECKDDAGDEQRLDDHHPADPQRDRLRDEPEDLGRAPE